MPKNHTAAMLKVENKKSVLDCIYARKRTTQTAIARDLNLSRPTVTQILKELVEDGHILREGLAESTGGRKANMYAFHGSAKIAVGLELLAERYEIIAIDLYAGMLRYEKKICRFENTDAYYEEVAQSVNVFIKGLDVEADQVLGVGIGLQALVSSDGKSIIYGKVLNCTGLHISQFTKRIPHRCVFNHDAESLANIELWEDASIRNAIFFNIHEHLSGAVIIDGDFFRGGELKSGVFEHMTIIPDGKPCYCGKRGCVNSYCSMSAFLEKGEEPEMFFRNLRAGKAYCIGRWEEYLENLAMVIDNLHMFITSDVILGGTLSRYLTVEDIERLSSMVRKRSAFPSNERYVKISRSATVPLSLGAALPMVKKYLNDLMK